MTGVAHSPAQMTAAYPVIFNSSIMPQSIITTEKAVSYTNAAISAIESSTPSVNLNSPMNGTKQFAFDNQACCFMVQDTLQARFWAEYRTLTATFTRATTIIASVTQYVDTTITNYETLDSLTNTTSTYVSQIGGIPATQTIDCNVPIIPTQLIGLNDSRNEPNKTLTTSIFYVYSTLKIIQVPPVTSANGLFQCTTKSEFLPCQASITFDSNPYLRSYYLSQPTAATQLPGSSNASIHVDTILTFPTPFTYLPLVGDRLEGLGYVPRSILGWMLQQDAHTMHASLLTSCSPGGPPLLSDINLIPSSSALSIGVSDIIGGVNTVASNIGGAATNAVSDAAVVTDAIGDMPKAGPVVATPSKDLTVSTAVTVINPGCFNPEACPTIRASPTLEASSASGDFISNNVKPGVSSMTVARSKSDDAAGKVDKAPPLLFTLGDQVITPHPAGFPIDGATISAGGRGLTIAGTAIRLESSGILKIGTSVVSMSNTAIVGDDLQLAAYSVGGQVFTPNGIAFRIAGTTISAGGPGVTISGTPIRLETSGILKIGTSVASIANVASTTDHYRLASVGTDIFTPDPTASAVQNSAASGADSIITVSVTPTNLATSGDQGTGGSTPTLTPKHSVKASDSRSGRNNNPTIKKRLGLLIIIYVICQIVAL